MINVLIGGNILVAKADVSFEDAGVTGINTEIIYELNGTARSYKPSREINAINGFSINKSYYYIAKQTRDLSNITTPPLTDPAPDLDYILDTFTDSDDVSLVSHESNSGDVWNIITGGLAIKNNALSPSSSFRDVPSIAVIDAKTSDITIEANLSLLNTGGHPVGIVCRVINEENYYSIQLATGGNGFRLYKTTEGIPSLVSFAPLIVTSGLLTVICKADRITAFLGSTIIEDTHATQGNTSTKFGVYMERSADLGDEDAGEVDKILDILMWEGDGLAPPNELKQFSLEYPNNYQVFQWDGELGVIKIKGSVYNPSGLVDIEARFKGGAWETIAENVVSDFEGELIGQTGQGLFEIRTNDMTRTASVQYVGIGDVYVIAGQSNASGVGGEAQPYYGDFKSGLFSNSYRWMELQDPADTARGQIDAVSADDSANGGSYWPPLATLLMANKEIPVAFIPCPLGGTDIVSWMPGGDHEDRSTLYGSMVYRAKAALGVKAVLWHQGESDATIAGFVSGEYYKGKIKQLADAIFADLGVKLIAARIHLWDGVPSTNESNVEAINQAIADAAGESDNILLGADLHEPTNVSDSLHFSTPEEYEEIATRWADALQTLSM